MPVTDITGPGGNATLPTGMSVHGSAWSATIELEDVETTGFVEVGNRTFDATTVMISGAIVGTGQGGGGTASQLVSTTGLGTAPSMTAWTGTVVLTGGYGGTYSGTNSMNVSFNAVMKSVALNRPQNGKLDAAYTFKSSGPITILQP